MRRFAVVAAVTAVAFVVAGCSGTVSTSAGGTIKVWPTAPALTGAVPVGYWECVDTFDVEELRTANRASAPTKHRCRNFDGEYAIEYRADHGIRS